MKQFYDFNDLIKEIKIDSEIKKGSRGRYFTRLIFLNDFNDFEEFLCELDVEKINLADNLNSPRKWFSFDKIIKTIVEKENSFIIYPLSEILRFSSRTALQSLLTTVVESQNKHDNLKKRCYIPLVGLYEKITNNFINKFHRKNEGPPIWRLVNSIENKKITVYKLDTKIKTKLKTIENNKQWLNFWKKRNRNPLISNSSSLNNRWDNFLSDSCFSSKSLHNISEFLEEIYSLNIKYEYIESEKNFWEFLLYKYENSKSNKFDDKSIYSYPDFNDFINDYFNLDDINKLSDIEIIELYLNQDKEENKWLIKCYFISENKNNSYIYNVIKKSRKYTNNEILKNLYIKILDYDKLNSDILSKRFDIIRSLSKTYKENLLPIEENFLGRLKELDNDKKIKILSGITPKEKKELISLIKEKPLKIQNQILERKIPDIYKYLDWKSLKIYDISIPDWFIDYFNYYNLSKYLNKPIEKFEKISNKINNNPESFYNWYYEFKNLPNLKGNEIIQVDALGVEWLPFIIHIFQEYMSEFNKTIESISIHRAKLPSITKNNKIDESSFISDLDDLLHDNKGYKHPDTLVKQLEIIRKIIINNLIKSDKKTIYLTADHGATCQCLKQFNRVKMYSFKGSKHEGRYMECQSTDIKNNSFIKNNDYIIGIRYISLNNVPRREVHGGGTPEEVLVPLIKIKENDKRYSIEIINKELDFDKKILKTKVEPDPSISPILKINDKKYNSQFSNGKYIFNLSELSPGKYSGIININDLIKKIDFTISSGYKERDLF